jgi:hypothetical protein
LNFQVSKEDKKTVYEIRHAAVEEGQLRDPEEFEGATFNVTTG